MTTSGRYVHNPHRVGKYPPGIRPPIPRLDFQERPPPCFTMGTMAPRPCNPRGCPFTIRGAQRYCNRHENEALDDRRRKDARRGTATERGYGGRWQRERAVYLALNPLCKDPDTRHEGRTIASTTVDHIKPHRADPNLFWDQNNWQALCKPCHDAKTGRGE